MKLFRKAKPFDYEHDRTCMTCSTVFKGRYCNQCGEKVVIEGEESLGVFFAEILNAFTFLDGKFIRSLRPALFNPGLYSKEYARGIRVPYMKPVSFFFVANFIFFLFPFITTNTLSTPLQYQHLNKVYGSYVPAVIEDKMAEASMTREELEEAYNSESASLTKLLIIVLVFLFAILFSIVNYKRSVYFAHHFFFAFEFMSFFLYVNMILLSSLVMGLFYLVHLLGLRLSFAINDSLLTSVFAVTTLYFLIRGIRTFYGQKWVVSIAKTLLIMFLMTFVFSIYKGLLFYLSMWRV